MKSLLPFTFLLLLVTAIDFCPHTPVISGVGYLGQTFNLFSPESPSGN